MESLWTCSRISGSRWNGRSVTCTDQAEFGTSIATYVERETRRPRTCQFAVRVSSFMAPAWATRVVGKALRGPGRSDSGRKDAASAVACRQARV